MALRLQNLNNLEGRYSVFGKIGEQFNFLVLSLCKIHDFMGFAITVRPNAFSDYFVISFAFYKKGI